MTCLGLILHQLGCWKIAEDEDLGAARDVADSREKDLQTKAAFLIRKLLTCALQRTRSTGVPRVYREVFGPLQKLLSDLR